MEAVTDLQASRSAYKKTLYPSETLPKLAGVFAVSIVDFFDIFLTLVNPS